MIDPVENVIHN